MTTLDEFREFVETLPEEAEPKTMTADHVFDSTMLSSKLTDATFLDEMYDVIPKVSEDTRDILNNLSYLDKGAFVEDYAKIPTKDVNNIKEGLYEAESKNVENLSSEMAANKLMEEVNLDNANSFIKQYKKNLQTLEEIKDEPLQKAYYVTGELATAENLKSLHRNYITTCKEFNSRWIWHVAEQVGGFKQPKSKSVADIESSFEEDSLEDQILGDVEWAEVNKYSNESIAKTLRTKEDWINYTAAKRAWMNDKYGYPIDYIPESVNDSGAAESMYPFVSAALAMGVAPVKVGQAGYTGLKGLVGNLASRTNYGIAGAVLDAPITTGAEELFHGLSEFHPAIATAGTITAVMLLGPRAERVVAKSLKASKNLMVKSGNTLQQYAKVSKWGKNINMSEDLQDMLYGTVRGDYVHTDIPKMMPNAYGGIDNLELSYLGPQNRYNNSLIEAVEISADNVDVAKTAVYSLEHNKFKQNIKNDLDTREFTTAYREQIQGALDVKDVDSALDALGRHIDEAYETSTGLVDATKTWIPDADPNMLQRSYVNMLPEEFKATALRNPNALVNQSNAVTRSVDLVVKDIRRRLKPKWSFSDKKLKEFNNIIRQADSGEIELAKYLDSNNVDPVVKQAIVDYRKLNDKVHKHIDTAMVDIYKRNNVKKYGDQNVKVLDEGKGLVEDIETRAKFTVNTDDLDEVTTVLPYTENYMHRHAQAGTVVLHTKDIKTGAFKTIDTFPTYKAAVDYRKANGLTKDAPITRIGEDPASIINDRKYSTMVSNANEVYSPDKDKLIDLLNDLGVSGVEDNIDDILKATKDTFGIKDLTKAKPPVKLVGKKRTREKAFTYGLDEPLESMKSYSHMVTRAIVEQPYIDKFKGEFFAKFGKYLENPTDYTSKMRIGKADDPTGSIQRSGELLQNQIKNLERIPHQAQVQLQTGVDRMLERLYTSDNKLYHGVGKILETQNKYLPFTKSARSMGYLSTMALQAKQIPLQSSFALFGMFAHSDMFLKNPLVMGRHIKNFGALGTSIMADKVGKLGKFVKLSPELKLMKKEIYDAGYIDDLLGTETGGGRGLSKAMVDVAMSPVAIGELGNRLSNISIAFEKAKLKGLKIGTQEHRRFVSTYYSKYAQVLNHLTDSPLTKSPWTSWNIGAFKKFQIQWFDQYWNGLKGKQKIMAGAAMIALYGKYGIPGASEGVEMYNMLEEKWLPIYTHNVIQAMEDVAKLTEEEGIKILKERYADNPDMLKTKLKQFKDDFKTKGDLTKRINNMSVGDFIQSDEPLSNTAALVATMHNMLNYEGYFDNLAVNVGWSSYLENLRLYGPSSMFGPFVNSITKSVGGDTSGKFADMTAIRDGMYENPKYDAVLAEGRRLAKTLAPGPYKSVESFIQFGEISGAINRNELTDKDGNLMDWTNVFDDLEVQLDIPFKEQKAGQMGTVVLKPTTSLAELGWKVLGFKGKEVKKQEKAHKDVLKYYNNLLRPMIGRLAEQSVFHDMNGNPEMSLALQEMFTSYIGHRHGPGSPVYDWCMRALDSEMSKIEWRRKVGGEEWTQMQRAEHEAFLERIKNKPY